MVASTMVVHVAPRGKDMAGLVRYLYGPGKANEHTDQHAVAASNGLEFGYSGALTAAEASELGRLLEESWHDQMAEANVLVGAGNGGVARASMKAGGGEASDSEKEHVYHLIVSLPPGTVWSDDEWAMIARDVVKGMGFSAGPDDERGCRWVAIRHGLSANGNDHLHLAVNLVRQDGRRARLPKGDYSLANAVRRSIEERRDFVLPLHDVGRTPVRSLPAYTMAEHAIAKARGHGIPDRVVLQQVIRAAAMASRTEAEWIAGVLEGQGVELEPARWAPGGREVVTGYKVRLGDGPWLTGSQLAPDLTLARMRPRWTDNETDTSRDQARKVWLTEGDLPATVAPRRVSEHLDAAEEHLARWADELRSADPFDKAGWRETARQAAGVATTFSLDGGPQRVALSDPAQTLSRQALHGADQTLPALARRPGFGSDRAQLAARQMQVALRAGGPASHPGWIAVLQQLRQVVDAMRVAQQARQELSAAQQLARASQSLTVVEQQLRHQLSGDLDGPREAHRAREDHLGSAYGFQHLGGRGPSPADAHDPVREEGRNLHRGTGIWGPRR